MNQEDKKPFIQPVTKTMEGNMQTSFSKKISKQNKFKELMDKKEKEELLQEVKDKKEIEKLEAFQKITPNEVQDEILHYEKNQTKTESKASRTPAFRRLKGFKEMEINEKLSYLLNFPKQLPPVPCNVITASENVRGFVTSLNEDHVEIRLMDQTKTTIMLHAIQDVKMLGI